MECCKILIEEFGALPDLVDANGNTAASYALEEGHEDVYEFLSSLDVPNDHYVTEVATPRRYVLKAWSILTVTVLAQRLKPTREGWPFAPLSSFTESS